MKQQLNEVKQLQKIAGILNEAPKGKYYIKVAVRDAKRALEIIRDNPAYSKAVEINGSDTYYFINLELTKYLEMDFGTQNIEVIDSNIYEEPEEQDDDDDYGSDNPDDDYGPVTDYGKRRQDDDAKYYGLGEDSVRMWKSDNPEGDKMVMNFLKMIAKEFKYPPAKGNPLAQAAEFVKGRLKKLGYINEN